MADNDTVFLNTKVLDQLIAALGETKPPVARVGVLGDKTSRGGQTSNAQVGAAHEFGTTTIPRRSFLREPLNDHLKEFVERAGAFDKAALSEVVRQKSLKPWVTNLAIIAKDVVLEAFNSSGFGKWRAWKNPNYKSKTGQILLDTTQLRNSITWDVK